MISKLFDRLWKSILIFWGGFHFIGFMMVLGDLNHGWNPIWCLISLMFFAELSLLKMLVVSAITVCAGFLILWIVSLFILDEGETAPSAFHQSYDLHSLNTQKISDSCMSDSQLLHSHSEEQPSIPKEELAPIEPPRYRPPILTPEELKEKALKDILRRY